MNYRRVVLKTIMTTEPKFIPNEAIEIEVKEGLTIAVRLVDCVGYTIPGAIGYEDETGPRMVNTPGLKKQCLFRKQRKWAPKRLLQIIQLLVWS